MPPISFASWCADQRAALKVAAQSLTGLCLAAWEGEEAALQTQLREAPKAVQTEALTWAAAQGHGRLLRILADTGSDTASRSLAAGFEGAYPLHWAVASGSLGAVTSLVTRGAELSVVDERWQRTPLEWAHALGETELVSLLEQALWFVPAIEAVRSGDTEALQAWLQTHPDQVDFRLGDNRRTLLLYATDWPGQWPNARATIELLVAAGADLQATFDGANVTQRETPLHWAASSNDLEALHALIAAGADINAIGGCIANGTPLMLAVCFHHWDSARALIEAGALYSLYHVAALGDLRRMEEFFDAQGRYQHAVGPMPYWGEEPSSSTLLNSALWFACMGKQSVAAQRLLAAGADSDWKGPLDKTPREVAEENGGRGFRWAIGGVDV